MLLRELANLADTGTYVGVHLSDSTEALIREWAGQNGLPERKEYHVTLAYSRKMFPVVSDANKSFFAEAKGFEVFDNNTLVLTLHSDDLMYRFNQFMSAGATYDYDTYNPHITIGKDLIIDVKDLVLPDFRIVLDREYSEDLDLSRPD